MHKLSILASISVLAVSAVAAPLKVSTIDKQLKKIEDTYQVKVGVYAIDTNSDKNIAYNADKRFPFQSTCKFMGVSALLAKDTKKPILQKAVTVTPQDMLFWHPISGQYLNKKTTLQTLAEGAISYSDNPAINIIIRNLGGLDSVNQFARNLGNQSFVIKHYEVNLNSNPKKVDDTSTPKDMGLSVEKILLGDVLTKRNKALLINWMRNNTTGYNRIRAGVPLGWTVADKTGSGSFGVANDIGIAWSPMCKPVVLSIFTYSSKPSAKPRDVVIKEVTKAVFDEFSQYATCYQATNLG